MVHALAPDELIRRYKALYTGAVSDVLDRLGLRQQALPHTIMPLTLDTVVAGPAFTGQGYPASDVTNDDSETRIRMLESIKPGTVSVWSSAGHFGSAHWGEIMSNAARERGCFRAASQIGLVALGAGCLVRRRADGGLVGGIDPVARGLRLRCNDRKTERCCRTRHP